MGLMLYIIPIEPLTVKKKKTYKQHPPAPYPARAAQYEPIASNSEVQGVDGLLVCKPQTLQAVMQPEFNPKALKNEIRSPKRQPCSQLSSRHTRQRPPL